MSAPAKTLVICISLPGSPRREGFIDRAKAMGLGFHFLDAVSIADVQRGVHIPDCQLDLTHLGWTGAEQTDARRRIAPLLYGEIACAYSHLAAWQLARNHDADRLVVFEDDAIMLRPLQLPALPEDADMLYLHNHMPRNAAGEAAGEGWGNFGYLLTRAGLAKCQAIFRTLYMPVDLQMVVHQRAQIRLGHRLTRFRQALPEATMLNAYVAPEPFCAHPPEGDSTIFPGWPEPHSR